MNEKQDFEAWAARLDYDDTALELRFLDLTDTTLLAALETGLEPAAGRLYVFSDEWGGRKDQVKGFILGRLGTFERRFGARETKVREVPRLEATAFLDLYHIQGSNHLSVQSFGLYVKDELVGLMSMGRHSRQIAQNRIVLDRLCFKKGVQVIGGASKLFKRCVEWAKTLNYDEIVSFSDNRWTEGAVYGDLGFDLDKTHRPDYCYVQAGVRLSKQSQKKKSSCCPETMSEREWAAFRGLTRIYDAGKKRWLLNLKPGEHRTRRDLLSEKCAKQHQNGAFMHSHIRGYFGSAKNSASVYFGSSFELRCLYLLENDPAVVRFRRCDAFKGQDSWRNPDLWVEFVDGRSEIWEVKPEGMLELPEVREQLKETSLFAAAQGVAFRVWTEKQSGLRDEHAIVEWARKYLAETGTDPSYLEHQRESRRRIRTKYAARVRADTVDVWCDFCTGTHTVKRLSHDKNVKRNGTYICERHGGHIAGKKPKAHLKKTNPYAAEGKKACTQCLAVKEFERFDVRRASWDGRAATCKDCVSAKNKIAYEGKKVSNAAKVP